jgi:hypothetical protein
MVDYTERHFVQALVPLLISRLPDPFSPNEADMLTVASAAGRWAEMLINLRADPDWQHFMLERDGPAWNEPAEPDQ